MFEPKTYWEKRAGLTEAFVDQLARRLPADLQVSIAPLLGKFQMEQYYLRCAESAEVVGIPQDLATVATQPKIESLFKANLGRGYWQSPNAASTTAPQGNVGTSSFGMKFANFMASLPRLDESVKPDMGSLLVADYGRSRDPQVPCIPTLILVGNTPQAGRTLNFITVYGQTTVETLYLDHLPAEFPWNLKDFWRSEAVRYIGHLTVDQLVVGFASALQPHLQGKVIVDFELSLPEIDAISKALPEGMALQYIVQAEPLPTETGRGETTPIIRVDEAGYYDDGQSESAVEADTPTT